MMTEMIDHDTLTKLCEAGDIRTTHVVGNAGGWGIVVQHKLAGSADALLRSQHVQTFRKLETLVGYLKTVGIVRFEVDSIAWTPDSDSAYDQWLKAEVQEAIDDLRPSIPNEQAKDYFAGKRAALRRRIADGKA